jgi:hypothetical protein
MDKAGEFDVFTVGCSPRNTTLKVSVIRRMAKCKFNVMEKLFQLEAIIIILYLENWHINIYS